MQAGDAARVLALRWLLPLLAAAAAAALSPAHAWHAAVMALCALSPLPAAVSPQIQAQEFSGMLSICHACTLTLLALHPLRVSRSL